MAYELTEDDVAFLRSRYGTKALQSAAELELTSASLLGDLTQLRARYPERAAALAETVRARRRAAGKLRDAEHLLADETAVQQATASPVAALRAADIVSRRPGAVVQDITCSIGGELAALAAEPGVAGVIGSDLDPVRLAMAQHNLEAGVSGRRPTLLRADALTPTSTADVIIADPGRRNAGGRVFGMDQLDPPLLELLSVYAGRALAVKCAPGLDYRNLRTRFGFEGQVQIVSLDGGVREACLWTEVPGEPENRASVLRTQPGEGGRTRLYEVTSDDPDDLDEPGVDDWIVDPDGAVVRAGLVRQYAHRHGLRQLDPQIAYLTGDAVPAGERGFRVIEQLPVHEKVLRGALAARGCGSLEILVRGLDVDPDRLRKKLKLKGSAPYALVLTRIGRQGVAFLCAPGVRAG